MVIQESVAKEYYINWHAKGNWQCRPPLPFTQELKEKLIKNSNQKLPGIGN